MNIAERYQSQRHAEATKKVCDLPIPELPDFYAWFNQASEEERIEELAERIDWLAGHICVGLPDASYPYWGSEELYMALDRCRLIAQWGLRHTLPSNVVVLAAQGR